MHSEWAGPRLSKHFEFRHTAIRVIADTDIGAYAYHQRDLCKSVASIENSTSNAR